MNTTERRRRLAAAGVNVHPSMGPDRIAELYQQTDAATYTVAGVTDPRLGRMLPV